MGLDPPEDAVRVHGQPVHHAERRVTRHLPCGALVDIKVSLTAAQAIETQVYEHIARHEREKQMRLACALGRQAVAWRHKEQAHDAAKGLATVKMHRPLKYIERTSLAILEQDSE